MSATTTFVPPHARCVRPLRSSRTDTSLAPPPPGSCQQLCCQFLARPFSDVSHVRERVVPLEAGRRAPRSGLTAATRLLMCVIGVVLNVGWSLAPRCAPGGAPLGSLVGSVGVRHRTAVMRSLGLGRRRRGLRCKRSRCAPLWHIKPPHSETPAVRRASHPVFRYVKSRPSKRSEPSSPRDDPGDVFKRSREVPRTHPGTRPRPRRVHQMRREQLAADGQWPAN